MKWANDDGNAKIPIQNEKLQVVSENFPIQNEKL